MLFLELGCVPFRQLIMKRRILFLHHILNENENSMLYKFLMAQIRSKKKKDWISQVTEDLEKLNMNKNLEKLKLIKKSELKIIVDKLIKEDAFNELSKMKENHSKVRSIKHKNLEMQNYLKCSEIKIMQDEAQEIFKIRCRVTEVKNNFKGRYENVECDFCDEQEDQKHILECKALNENNNEKYEKIPEYEEILKNNAKDQIKITRKFIENLEIRKQMAKQ